MGLTSKQRYQCLAKERDLVEWIEAQQGRVEALVERIVNMDSGTGHVAGVSAVAEVVAQHLRGAGVDAAVESLEPRGAAGSIVRAKVATDAEAPRALLLAHMDTVFSEGEAARRPFAVRGGAGGGARIATGPGVVDCKGNVALVALVMEGLLKFDCAGSPCNVEALLTSDEEVGSPVSGPAIRAAATGATAVFNVEGGDGRLPPAAGDSADGTVTVGRKASLVLTVRVEGKAAHAASPLDGASAIDALALKIVDLRKLNHFRVDGSTLNVGTVRGGSKFNIIADWAEAEVNIRAWTAGEMAKLTEGVRGVMERTHLKGTTGRIVRESSRFDPMEQTADTMTLFGFYSGLSSLLGANVSADRRGGAADSSIASAAGAPTLCSVGALGGDAHSEGEFLVLRSLVTRAQALALSIVRLSKAPLPRPPTTTSPRVAVATDDTSDGGPAMAAVAAAQFGGGGAGAEL